MGASAEGVEVCSDQQSKGMFIDTGEALDIYYPPDAIDTEPVGEVRKYIDGKDIVFRATIGGSFRDFQCRGTSVLSHIREEITHRRAISAAHHRAEDLYGAYDLVSKDLI